MKTQLSTHISLILIHMRSITPFLFHMHCPYTKKGVYHHRMCLGVNPLRTSVSNSHHAVVAEHNLNRKMKFALWVEKNIGCIKVRNNILFSLFKTSICWFQYGKKFFAYFKVFGEKWNFLNFMWVKSLIRIRIKRPQGSLFIRKPRSQRVNVRRCI